MIFNQAHHASCVKMYLPLSILHFYAHNANGYLPAEYSHASL